jgi:predicted RNA-binding protein (virulence factor B family)
MKDQINEVAQLKQKVLDKISENDGEIVFNDSSLIKAIFPENKIEQAVRAYFEITDW